MATASELKIDTNVTAMDMADSMFGEGVKVVSASFTGADSAKGIYSGADATAPGVAPSDSGVIFSTGNVTDVTQSSGDPNLIASTSTNFGLAGDADLEEIAGAKTYDAAVFEADFVPGGDTLTMQLTFSSEEYLEYVNSGYNDAIGVWVNGEKAVLSVGDGNITINSINDESSSNLYVDNPSTLDLLNTEMDGVTVTLTLKAPVKPGEVNSIKIAIADGGDGVYDSNLMIAADSLQTVLVAEDDYVDLEGEKEVTLDVLANDGDGKSELTITHINGQEVFAGDQIKLPSGEVVTLNKDGTLTILTDGLGEENNFSYTVVDGAGVTDTAFVKMTSTVPCFVAGTLIDTPRGPVPVEALQPGDAVLTRDRGVRHLTWVGTAVRLARGLDAPVRIAAGRFGDHGMVEVSPMHRILIGTPRAELLFGVPEVLVRAKDLVDGQGVIRREDGGEVRYVHLLFEQHEIVTAGGLDSESYQPGAQTLAGFDEDARAELFRLFPELASLGAASFGPAARAAIRSFEARARLS